ncbi:MAG: FAD/NAD(P)-binding protein [Alphaproteobacteria bacterium]|nr:FAD/NAD(P)-binding protein [Alphaproteobacteria bacterium]
MGETPDRDRRQDRKKAAIAIVGGGPRCTYAVERLAAYFSAAPPAERTLIVIFERTGRFGAGATHSDRQPGTSYMNRVASQIGFAADESHDSGTRLGVPLLPRVLRPSFHEWCRVRYDETGDPRYDLDPTDVPSRALHGEALRAMFDRYVALLRTTPNVDVDLFADEVVDIAPRAGGFSVATLGRSFDVARVLLVTGHTPTRPHPDTLPGQLMGLPGFVPAAYPLEASLTEAAVPPGATVGVLSLGLTAIDAILYLTEGRGGRFEPCPDGTDCPPLRYVSSGREPGTIIGLSPSGLPAQARPRNDKARDGSGRNHDRLAHRPHFLTNETVDRLRTHQGVPNDIAGRIVRQLDFGRHIFPLVVLEMAFVFYRITEGEAFGDGVLRAIEDRVALFRHDAPLSPEEGIALLMAPVEGAADALGLPFERRFQWRDLFHPLGEDAVPTGHAWKGADWGERMVSFLRADVRAAAQGNLAHPVKAAVDGVWRDLRSVFSYVLDEGGVTAASQRDFARVYHRHYQRMSNGAGLEAMRKVLALVEAGVLDLSIGPRPSIAADETGFRVTGGLTGTTRHASVLINGRMEPFDPERSDAPLFRNLLDRGLIRKWRNPGLDGAPDHVPGALDLDPANHPIAVGCGVDPRLTVIGIPAEGLRYFQLSAGRPGSDSGVFNELDRWAREVVGREAYPDGSPDRSPDGAGAPREAPARTERVS